MPIITSLEYQKKNKQRVNLYVDNEFCCGLSLEVVMKQGLKKGMELLPEFLATLQNQEDYIHAREAALRLLEVRPRSRAELSLRLKQKQIPAETIEKLLKDFEKSGLINDESFAKMLVRHLQSRQMGRFRISQELRAKGLSTDLIEQVLDETMDQSDDLERCREAAEKKRSSYQALDTPTAKRRMIAFLQRKGFNYDDVYQTVQQLFDEDQADGG